MKFWFSKKSSKAPYDATVEQTLLFAQEVNATALPSETDFADLASALRQPEHVTPRPQPQPIPASQPAAAAPKVRPSASNSMRDELERRSANYRAFQLKLNEEREARIAKTMADVRASLQQATAQKSRPLH
jgi:hypothetical protein